MNMDRITAPMNERVTALRETLANVRRQLAEVCSDARTNVVARAKTTDVTIRAHPYESMAVAFGVGIALGALISRRGNRSPNA